MAPAWDARTLGGGDGAPGIRALREHPDGSRGESGVIPGTPRRRVAAGIEVGKNMDLHKEILLIFMDLLWALGFPSGSDGKESAHNA